MPGMVKDRYSTYSKGIGKRIRDGKVSMLAITDAMPLFVRGACALECCCSMMPLAFAM